MLPRSNRIVGLAILAVVGVSSGLAKTIETIGMECQRRDVKACKKIAEIVTTAKNPKDRVSAIPFFSDTSVLSRIANDAAQKPEVVQAARARLDTLNRQALAQAQARAKAEWEAASRSGSMKEYYHYLEVHPNDHQADIQALADKWLRDKASEAERQGKQVKHFLYGLPRSQVGTTWALKGGEIAFGPVQFYSHPTDLLVMGVRESLFGPLEDYLYVGGKGIGISGDAVYCFGF
jgi:hypothetical protein